MNSSATGCFIITSCDVGTSKFMAVPINDGTGTVSGLESGICVVLIYDLERNGKPGIRPAAEIENIQVDRSSEGTHYTGVYVPYCACMFTRVCHLLLVRTCIYIIL